MTKNGRIQLDYRFYFARDTPGQTLYAIFHNDEQSVTQGC
jgi:hypothetical protein